MNLSAKLAAIASDTTCVCQLGSANATGSLLAFVGKEAVNAAVEVAPVIHAKPGMAPA